MAEVEAAGARYVVVAGGAEHQARHLRDELGVTDVPLLLDPERTVRRRVDIGRMRWRDLVSPRGARNYVGALRSGQRPGRIVAGFDLRPGIVLLDPDLRLATSWAGATYGDYTPLDIVLAELRRRAG